MAILRNWAGGIDNLSPADRIPDGYVRAMVNLDPLPGGGLGLRGGAEQLLACADCRGAFAVGRYLVIADGARLLSYSLDAGSVAELTASLPDGPLTASELNAQLYLSTPAAQYRTDGVRLVRWDVPPPAFTAAALPGGSLAGQYKVAVTALGEDGEESGAVPLVVTMDGARLQVISDDPRPLRLYVSPADSASLYYQGQILGGVALIEAPTDDKARLTTAHLDTMPPSELLVSHHSVLVGAVGRYVFLSEPMMPHLTNPVTRFFQYGSDVQALVPTDSGVFVVLADRTYHLTGVETEAPSQRHIDNIGGLAGSGVALPDGTAAWFSRHGLVIGGSDGSTAAPSRSRHAPMQAERAACGVLEHQGVIRVVACLQGDVWANPRARFSDALEDVTYAVALDTGAVTLYQGFAFEGFTGRDGASFAWKADGVYRLGVVVDEAAPIDARAEFPATDFGTNAVKRLQTAWLALDTDGQATLQVAVDGGPHHPHRVLGTAGTRKAPLARGLLGRRWTFTLELLEASHAALDSIEVEAGAAQRRIK
ncbi:hypothetical protein SAMN05216229_102123 [Geopseudomonas sagittaria]|uniref:Uncharacterized protein n=1 Tax=Geopseudomonas sagittaria TaxID=1135990 RepID=A0A1I5PZZ8_9GAMM|nr:hypothetical protein [Pseudomonas sagittaria]SFP39552.1 hypothetical protein SAMN05216229_102123 [Pseudomonas sagittaria]